MKRSFVVIISSLFLLFWSVLSVQAAIESIDFNSLEKGSIPFEGIGLEDVDIFGLNAEISDHPIDPSNTNNVITVTPGLVVFLFANSLFIDNIWVTMGTNSTPAFVQAFGTEGTASFSIENPINPPTPESINGIGYIHTVLFSGWESYISGLEYNTNPVPVPVPTPIPSALLLFGFGIVGMVGIHRKEK